MTLFSFTLLADELAVEQWRPLDRALYRWVISHGGSPRLAHLAAWASLADGNGDIAVALIGDDAGRYPLPALSSDALSDLSREAMVCAGGAEGVRRPFVLDADGRFYLWRNYFDETAVVAGLRQRLAARPLTPASEADVDELFHGVRNAQVQAQRRAVANACGQTLFVLTGGPGTGKTSTVLRMLLMLQRQCGAPLRIEVAAPTGKAAQRLLQSLRKGKQDLLQHPSAPLPAAWRPLLDAVPDQTALTLHRLLGFQPFNNRYQRSARDPITADIVLIDEASMVDVALMRCLLDALRPETVLILVGDAEQLTSVAAGSFLHDLVTAAEHLHAPNLVRLEHSFRAELPLVAINRAIQTGDGAALSAAMQAADAQAAHLAITTPALLLGQLQRWSALLVAELSEVVAAIGADSESSQSAVAAAMDALAQRQVLCALRDGPFGASEVNQVLEHLLRKAWALETQREWYPGRSIIITRNDYPAGLFNGDVGVCLSDAHGQLRVWFETSAEAVSENHAENSNAPQPRTFRSFAPGALPEHESAFAITIHKSQGSEYAAVAIILPPQADNRILSRQLLYTAASRAKTRVEFWASPEALTAALRQSVSRHSGIPAKIVESDELSR